MWDGVDGAGEINGKYYVCFISLQNYGSVISFISVLILAIWGDNPPPSRPRRPLHDSSFEL